MKLTLPGFSAPSPALPPPPPPLPTEDDAEVKAKANKSRIAAQSRKGLLSTNLTTGTGGGSAQDANTAKPTLLGQ